MRMKASADVLFLKLLVVAAVPVGALIFALSRATHDLQAVLAGAPSPVAGLCQDAVAYSLSPVAHASYVGFAGLAVLSSTLGFIAGITTHMRTRRRLMSARLSEYDMPQRLRRAARDTGVARLRLLDAPHPRAFTFGYVRPTVCISRGLLDCLDDVELEAVLRHENAHAHKLDPLRMLLVTSITRALFFAPLTKKLHEAFQIAKEVDADQAVIRAMGSARPLVSALIAAGEAPYGADTIAGFADTLSVRIDWLEGNETQLTALGTWRATAITLVAAIAVAAGLFVIVTGAVDAHVLHVCSDAGSGI
jgi:Zn-dependent protease with chaperone function